MTLYSVIIAVDFGEKEILEWLDCEQRLHHASEGLTLVYYVLCHDHTTSNSYSMYMYIHI